MKLKENLKFQKSESKFQRYNNITDTRLPWDKVWTPDIVLYNRYKHIGNKLKILKSVWSTKESQDGCETCKNTNYELDSQMLMMERFAYSRLSYFVFGLLVFWQIQNQNSNKSVDLCDQIVFAALAMESRGGRCELSSKWALVFLFFCYLHAGLLVCLLFAYACLFVCYFGSACFLVCLSEHMFNTWLLPFDQELALLYCKPISLVQLKFFFKLRYRQENMTFCSV